MNYTIMTHMVAAYPDEQRALQVAKGLIDGGASYLEVQFPFSDPTADGPVIQAACTQALAGGFTTEQGFAFIKIVAGMTSIPIFVMSYAAPVIHLGLSCYLERLRDCGAAGCIVPDLPVGCDEGLYEYAGQMGLSAVPVIAPNISKERLTAIVKTDPKYIYSALRAGITGSITELTDENLAFLHRLQETEVKIFGGFGIRSQQQVAMLSSYIHASVVGSYFLEVLQDALERSSDIHDVIRSRLQNLITISE